MPRKPDSLPDRSPNSYFFDYKEDELEFMKAIDRWKQVNHSQYPKCSDILAVLKSLGYSKQVRGKDGT